MEGRILADPRWALIRGRTPGEISASASAMTEAVAAMEAAAVELISGNP